MSVSIENYRAFKEELNRNPAMIRNNFGRAALLHDAKIVAFYDSVRDAEIVGEDKYGMGHFSIQVVGKKPADLGYFSSVRNL